MAETGRRQFVKYNFFKVDPLWRRLDKETRAEHKKEFASVVDETSADIFTRTFSLIGLRGDTDFLIWQASDDIEGIQDSATHMWSTGLGAYLTQPYSYLSMTHRSPYVSQHKHAGQEGTSIRLRPGKAEYFIVYPFLKTREWYLLPPEERQRMMNDHFRVGHEYPSVKINTTYSFGLDDQEFVVAFETDNPSDFLDLVMDLRGVEGSLYTLRDTPIFTCIHKSIDDTLDSLAG
jgi:chlorite dismutase